MKIWKSWFTLIEIMMWVLIFAIVIVWWFAALTAVNTWKIKLMQSVNITKDAYYFSERLFEEIKKWWTIDFEEYFNRKVVWTAYLSGHYLSKTWFWNYWDDKNVWDFTYGNSFYYCRSWVGDSGDMSSWTLNPNWGCYSTGILNTLWVKVDGKPQRYWQYAFQFIDYNSNLSNDTTDCWATYNLWDEDCDWYIRGDDDDDDLWFWPVVFTWWADVKEIYLISWDKKKRTLFRWNVKTDPDAFWWASCDFSNPANPTWSWCLWTIEFLKLDWRDWWVNHSSSVSSTWSYDWIIDTWLIDKNFSWGGNIVAWWPWDVWFWQPLFPNGINVKNYRVYMYPNIDVKNSWKDSSASTNINPYLRISFTLMPSWKVMAVTKWKIPEIEISTTINLADYFNY